MTDIQKLKELAGKATPGPWAAADWLEKDGSALTSIEARTPCVNAEQRKLWGGDTKPLLIAECNEGQSPLADAAFIAACSPDVILGLIARLEAHETVSEEEVERVRQTIFDHVTDALSDLDGFRSNHWHWQDCARACITASRKKD